MNTYTIPASEHEQAFTPGEYTLRITSEEQVRLIQQLQADSIPMFRVGPNAKNSLVYLTLDTQEKLRRVMSLNIEGLELHAAHENRPQYQGII